MPLYIEQSGDLDLVLPMPYELTHSLTDFER